MDRHSLVVQSRLSILNILNKKKIMVFYMISEDLANRILGKLDGWVLKDDFNELGDPDSNLDPDPDPYPDSNNTITLKEVDESFLTAKSKATLHIRNNPIVYNSNLVKDFTEAVICWAASDLWRKYNHALESPGEEGSRQDNRGKDLWLDGMSILNNLRTSTLQGLS
jgi:hypothetical protein